MRSAWALVLVWAGCGPGTGGPSGPTTAGPAPTAAEERAPHGAACGSWRDCRGRVCIDAEVDPSFVGGYCSALCDPGLPAGCGPGAHCLDAEVFPPMCTAGCESDADCRGPDYVCIGVCVPDDFTDPLVRPGEWTGGEPGPAAAAAAMDPERLLRHAAVLSGAVPWDRDGHPVTIRSRALGHPDREWALAYLEAELQRSGFETVRRPYTRGGTAQVNLEATRRGGDPARPPVLVTAHWDSTGSGDPAWRAERDPAPGAVDNASGVAVALEIAAWYAARPEPPARSLRVVLFDGEEAGLWGSAEYVASQADPSDDRGCVLNVDMIGWTMPPTEGRVWVVYDETSRAAAGSAVEAAERFVPAIRFITSDYRDAGFSDHASFQAVGWCAVSLASFPRDRSNHTPADRMETFDVEYYLTVARGAAAMAAAWLER